MNWRMEALAQNVAARLPFGRQLYYLGQRVAGGFRAFDITAKVRQAADLRLAIETVGGTLDGRRTVEIGAGWVPIVPLCFWLHGQARCDSVDVVRLYRPALIRRAAYQLHARRAEFCQFFGATNERRWEQLPALAGASDPVAALSELCRIHLHAPVDTGACGLPAAQADIVYSNTVLEHVPPAEIPRLLSEACRLLRLGGITAHQIDLSDHFSHTDKRLSPIHFLTQSQRVFDRYNNPILYQNRWRAGQYRRAIEASGLTICHWDPIVDEAIAAQLPSPKIHADFRHLAREELATTGVRVVAHCDTGQALGGEYHE